MEGNNLPKVIKLKFLKKQYLSANEQVERDFITDVARHSRFAVPLAGGGTGAVDPPVAAFCHLACPVWAVDSVNFAVAKGLPQP